MALPFFPRFFDNRNRTFKNRTLLDALTEYEVRKHCGMPRDSARDLFDILEPHIALPTKRCHATPAETQFISAMSFLRSGTFQYVEGTVSGVSQSTVSRVIQRFSKNVVQNMLPASLQFPSEGRQMNLVKSEFFKLAQLPSICGLIDGTHVYIKSPGGAEEPAFVNRKLKHSINVQVVANYNHAFSDIVVRWPGSTHDSFMWRQSGLRDRFVARELENCYLLGKNITCNSCS